MAEETIYSNLDGGGNYRLHSSHGVWATCRAGSGVARWADFILETQMTVSYHISRSFLEFTVPDFSPVSPKAASLFLKNYSVEEMEVAKPNGIITEGLQTNPLVIGDWAAQTGEIDNKGQADMSTFPAPGFWAEIPFNAAGLTLIENKYGSTLKLCLRCQRDVEDDPPLTGGIRIIFGTPSEGANKPYIVLTFGAQRSQGHII